MRNRSTFGRSLHPACCGNNKRLYRELTGQSVSPRVTSSKDTDTRGNVHREENSKAVGNDK